MAPSLVNIYVHVIFATKGREPIILGAIESKVHERLQTNLTKMGSEVFAINGSEDHVHILLRLAPSKSIAETIRWSKGETSHWFNNKLAAHTSQLLYWQVGYTAFSVSEKELHNVKQYIINQKAIHHETAFAEEIEILKRQNK